MLLPQQLARALSDARFERLAMLPHVIIGPAALIRIRMIVIAVLASLSEIILSIRHAVPPAIHVMLRVV